MRLLPLLTACLVAIALYAVIMERDFLRAMANGGTTPEPVAEAAADAGPAQAEAVSVVVQPSRAQPVQSGIVLSGRTEAVRKVEVRAETSGLVVSEPIRKGASVEKGQLLCELDPGTRAAELAEAEARLVEAETNLRTTESLRARGFSSETDLISRRAAFQAAEAQVERARRELDRLSITAPFDGLLETDTAELGALLQPGAACATVIALDPIRLVGFVPELDVEKVMTGAPAGARLVTGQVLSGQVTFLSRSADPVTRTFRVDVEVPNPDLAIRDGVTAEILIGLAGRSGHLLPQSALTLNDRGQLGVRINDDGTARFVPVELIRDEARGVWVGGLPETAEVIVVGQEFVEDGRAITVTRRQETTQ
ncbi:efflux RND transporter periplasmic adaptor subunit [Halovulum dunhuangense]|uniref:Efflux RND transporter periplasmic adaptor subunit n=1 Tax=Halovulum dunhuangense TaxID=1505036 RepID=A0A849L630_9RHOB|nr:efflux RND transporter periplasmic adaptor subunit [Halovulum dunhuangense]NNU81875.1 efflux RND transporter periplasmic adaptor subunit [Halovulum dunhuangense]